MGETKKIYWDPWSGCRKLSEGCKNCYARTKPIKYNGEYILCRFNKTMFYLPTNKTRKYCSSLDKNTLQYKIPSGTEIVVCDNSDFFLEEADYYRKRAWKQIMERKDCLFSITTKRPDRFFVSLPTTWTLDGWNNVCLNVSIENQVRADERIPVLLELPVRHKGIEIAPLYDRIDIRRYLSTGQIDKVTVAGEQITKADESIIICNYEFVEDLHEQCIDYDVSFEFKATGNKLYKDKKIITVNKIDEANLAEFYNLNHTNNTLDWEQNVRDMENLDRIEQAASIWDKLKREGIR